MLGAPKHHFNPQHVYHILAHYWFAQHISAGGATCPLTQDVLLHILGMLHPYYPNSSDPLVAVMLLLIGLLSHPHHQCWADELSWSATTAIRGDQVLAHGQITDVYLLALAVHLHGSLASFDSPINTRVVPGGQDALHLIQSSP